MKTVGAKRWMTPGVSLFAGAIFAVGLILGGMTQPAKVMGFLDIAGAWDPSLAFVMIGAIGVHFVARRITLRRSKPMAAESFDEPIRKDIDAPLVVGAAMFGVGWGMSGVCPGPALVALGSGSVGGVVFAVAMACGMRLHSAVRPTLEMLGAEGAELMRSKRPTSRAQTDG